MSKAMRLGLVVAGVTLVLDQALKLWILFVYELAGRGRVEILPFMDFVMVWNRGISYGLFQQDGTLGRFVLFAISAVASVFLLFWLRRESSPFTCVALGLILGGAVGNAIDRLAYGAVADFVLLHAGGWEWYVFNVADAGIVVGVALLLYAGLWRGTRTDEAKTPAAGNEG